MSSAACTPDTDVIEGVYLCTRLNLPDLFGSKLASATGLRLYAPEDVPDPSRIRFALVWLPADDAFDAYPNIEFIQVIAAGVDGVLKNPSLPEHAIVARVNDEEQAAIMSGFAAWHIVWHHRQMGRYLEEQAEAAWRRTAIKQVMPPSQVTVGLLGYGLMGRAIAAAAAAMGFDVVVATRSQGAAGPGITRICGEGAVRTVATRSDILINVLPLTAATHNILNAGLFAMMPRGAALIQLGRGEQLDEQDLLAALESGQLGGASLDVFRTEPLPTDHPFWIHPKIVVTPHEASVSSPKAVAEALVRSVEQLKAGIHPTAAVDKATGY